MRADMLRRRARVVASLACVLALRSIALAQTNERAYEEYAFRLVTPGARAVGLGKTFTGLADDATAALTNPAGLSNLLEPELSIELIGSQISNERVTEIARDGSLGTARFGQFVTSPSFVSVIWPVRDLTLSFFRQQLQKYRERFTLDGARYIPNADQQSRFTLEAFSEGVVDIDAVSYGGGLAYVLSDKLSLGGTLVLTTGHVDVRSQSGCPTGLPWNSVVRGSQSAPPTLCPEDLGGKGFVGASTTGRSRGASGIVGVLFKPSPNVSLGATFYRGATLTFTTSLEGQFTRSRPDGREFEVDTAPPRPFAGCQPTLNGSNLDLTGCSAPLRYRVPDKWSTGLAWSPRRSLTMVADISHTLYSQIVSAEFLIVDFNDPRAHLSPANYYVNDVTEVHVGAEYRVYRPTGTLSFRGGFYSDPSHALRFRAPPAHELIAQASGADPNIGNPAAIIAEDYRFNLIPPRTRFGYTGGFGITVTNGIQFDVAGSWGPDSREIVASTVLRFCRLLPGRC
jgi:long-chain fatty acid transport protein